MTSRSRAYESRDGRVRTSRATSGLDRFLGYVNLTSISVWSCRVIRLPVNFWLELSVSANFIDYERRASDAL